MTLTLALGMAMEEATMIEKGALALLRFSLDLELSNHQMALILPLKAFVVDQSVVELMMTKESLFLPTLSVRRLSGEAVMCCRRGRII